MTERDVARREDAERLPSGSPSLGHEEVETYRTIFLRQSASFGVLLFARFMFCVIRAWLSSARWIAELRKHAADTGADVRFDRSDAAIFSAVGAIGTCLPTPQGGYARHERPSWQLAGILYGGVSIADSWIDSSPMTAAQKKDFAAKLIERATVGHVTGQGGPLDPERAVFDKCAVTFSYVRACLLPTRGWSTFVTDMNALLEAGGREFEAVCPSSCLAAAEQVGATSGALVFDIAHSSYSGDSVGARRAAMLTAAIINIVDDILDWDEDLRQGVRTFVTTSATVEVGQELGYRRCCELYEELRRLVDDRELQSLRGLFGSWWLRNALLGRQVRDGDWRLLFASGNRTVTTVVTT